MFRLLMMHMVVYLITSVDIFSYVSYCVFVRSDHPTSQAPGNIFAHVEAIEMPIVRIPNQSPSHKKNSSPASIIHRTSNTAQNRDQTRTETTHNIRSNSSRFSRLSRLHTYRNKMNQFVQRVANYLANVSQLFSNIFAMFVQNNNQNANQINDLLTHTLCILKKT